MRYHGTTPIRPPRGGSTTAPTPPSQAINSIVVLSMCDGWRKCLGRRVIPLPTQDCACHRIEFIDALVDGHQDGSARSVVVTELASSKLLQIKTRNIRDTSRLVETVSTDADGFEVRQYATAEDCEDAGRAV